MFASGNERLRGGLVALSAGAVVALFAMPALAQDAELGLEPASEEPRLSETEAPSLKTQLEYAAAPTEPPPLEGGRHVWVTHYGEYEHYLNDAAGGDGTLSSVEGHIYATNFAGQPAKVGLQGLMSDGSIEHERDFAIGSGATSQLMPERDQHENPRELTWLVTSDRQLILTGYAEVHLYSFDEDQAVAFESRAVAKRDLTIVEADCSLADHALACSSATRRHPWQTWLD